MSERVPLEDELTDAVRKLNTAEWERDEARHVAARCYATCVGAASVAALLLELEEFLGAVCIEQYPRWLTGVSPALPPVAREGLDSELDKRTREPVPLPQSGNARAPKAPVPLGPYPREE